MALKQAERLHLQHWQRATVHGADDDGGYPTLQLLALHQHYPLFELRGLLLQPEPCCGVPMLLSWTASAGKRREVVVVPESLSDRRVQLRVANAGDLPGARGLAGRYLAAYLFTRSDASLRLANASLSVLR